jgi:tetratricopeptide (TPR) repeat protein
VLRAGTAAVTLFATLSVALHLAAAQTSTGVSVTVVDSKGAPIPGVLVSVTNPETGQLVALAKTDEEGRVIVSHGAEVRSFSLAFEKDGYLPAVVPLRVTLGSVTRRTVVLATVETGGGVRPPPSQGQAARAYDAGIEARRAGDLAGAAGQFRRAAELDPSLAAAHTALAGIFILEGRWEEAAAEAEKAIELDPGDRRALLLSYEAYRNTGDTEQALRAATALKRAGVGDEEAGRAYNQAIAAYGAGDRVGARRLLEEVAATHPDLTLPRVFLAAICREDGDLGCTEAEIAAVLKIEPDNPRALRIAYEIAAERADWPTERAMADKLAAADPDYAGEQLLVRSADLYDAGHVTEAAALASLVLEVRPDAARAHFILGMVSYRRGNLEIARDHLERFVELSPNDPDAAVARDFLSSATRRSGETE